MAQHDDENRWVAHRREGWTVETDHGHDPVSVHDTYDSAREALDADLGAEDDRRSDGG